MSAEQLELETSEYGSFGYHPPRRKGKKPNSLMPTVGEMMDRYIGPAPLPVPVPPSDGISINQDGLHFCGIPVEADPSFSPGTFAVEADGRVIRGLSAGVGDPIGEVRQVVRVLDRVTRIFLASDLAWMMLRETMRPDYRPVPEANDVPF